MSARRYCEHCKETTMQDWVNKDFICRKCHRIVNYRLGGITNIIHAGINNGSISFYACNNACGYHSGKIDFSWTKVTCKKCLNLINKYERSEKDGCIMLGGPKK
jgi:hypothetical protein